MKSMLRIASPLVIPLLTFLACSEPTRPRAPSRARADAATAASPSYTITDLGTLGGTGAEALAINDAGQVVGSSQTAKGEQHAFLWMATSGMTDLGTLGGTFSRAFAINQAGHVAGMSALPSGERRPFLWTPSDGMKDLGTFGGTSGRARGINDLDQVVGSSRLPDGSFHAFLWSAAQGLTDLAPLVGNNSEANRINNRQQVVGGNSIQCLPTVTIAFLWSAREGFRDLGALGHTDPCGGAIARAVNELDQAVGLSETDAFVNDAFVIHAFRWTATTGMVDIGTLFGPSGSSEATAVNERGRIAGLSITPDGTIQHAFVWDEPTGMHDLGTFPGDAQSEAHGINSRGQIAGISIGGYSRAVLWTPTP